MNKTLIIAGGGTGGHIFPGLAVAEAWKDAGGKVFWAGSDLGKEKVYVPENGIELFIIPVSRVKGKGILGKLVTLTKLPGAIFKAMRVLKKIKPDVVLGVGGYASFAMTMAAFLKRVPVAIAEQNAYAGLTNRVLSKFSKKIFLSFEDEYQQFSAKKVDVVGNAIRANIQTKPYPENQNPFCIFITGGSLGAVALNENIRKALQLLAPFWSRLKIVHQVGENDFETSKKDYQNMSGLNVVCEKFFTDMHKQYEQAHLIICRAGASTATEIALSGRPALFVPYPYAADDHQTKNANYYVKRHAALMVQQKDLRPDWLAEKIEDFLANPEELKTLAENIKKVAKPHAATKIKEGLLALCQ